jgi:hypothetical protein
MKYLAFITIFFASLLSAIEKFPASYWWDADGNVFVEVEHHKYLLEPQNHCHDCRCYGGKAYEDAIQAAIRIN